MFATHINSLKQLQKYPKSVKVVRFLLQPTFSITDFSLPETSRSLASANGTLLPFNFAEGCCSEIAQEVVSVHDDGNFYLNNFATSDCCEWNNSSCITTNIDLQSQSYRLLNIVLLDLAPQSGLVNSENFRGHRAITIVFMQYPGYKGYFNFL